MHDTNIIWFDALALKDIDKVGGKNASLGELICHLSRLGVRVPNGFATTASAYRHFLKENGLNDKIQQALLDLNPESVTELAAVGRTIRDYILAADFPTELEKDIRQAYEALLVKEGQQISCAIRSSATAEDLPQASFAGQQDTILNINGIDEVLKSIKVVFSSLFTDRAISYRAHHGFDHLQVALSVGIQKMVRSDQAASGVMFTLDTESGFDGVVFITSSYGLGELIVQGTVNPDEFYVEKRAILAKQKAILSKRIGSKQQMMVYADEQAAKPVKIIPVSRQQQDSFSLTDEEITFLASQALLIEQHYQCPMDIEWAKDGITQELYIVQARPETVKSQSKFLNLVEKFILKEKGIVLVEGRSVGQKIGQGKARLVKDISEINQVQVGDILVTDMTDPDWEPVMKRSAAIVTNRGGRTCHAAIIAREMGIPAVVGCQDATKKISDGQTVTVSCAEGDTGFVYSGLLSYEKQQDDISAMPPIETKIMMNVGNPNQAFAVQQIPSHGVGLARLEFIINQMIGIHPRACLEFEKLDQNLKAQISEKTKGYINPKIFYKEKLKEGVGMIAAAFWPKPVIIRFSDFKSNEYANLLGGQAYEPNEENPMLGFRGASRYVAPQFESCFELECEAIKCLREEHGLTNIQVMIPFVRSIEEAQNVITTMARFGLKRKQNNLKVIMMCELPCNAILAEEFLAYFDGFSIGSNDLTQLTLGVDRDSGIVANTFDEKNFAVKFLLERAIQACLTQGKYIGICGQAPSDHPDMAEWLMGLGIESMSLTPDSVISTWQRLGNLKALT